MPADYAPLCYDPPAIYRMRAICTTIVAALGVYSLAGCVPAPSRAAAGTPLLASLQASTGRDSVHFLLQVTNVGSGPQAVVFTREPLVDFTVHRSGFALWTSAPAPTLARDQRSDTIQAGDTRSFQASWAPPMGLRGDLSVTAVLHDLVRPIHQSARFRIP